MPPEKMVRTPEMEEKIFELLCEGKTNAEVCKTVGISQSLMARWRTDDVRFDRSYARAANVGLEAHADSLLTTHLEEIDVNRLRLKSENIRWILSKRMSGKYGDRLDVNVGGTIDISTALSDARARAGLLSPCYPKDIENAELTETKQLPDDSETGLKPVASDAEASPDLKPLDKDKP